MKNRIITTTLALALAVGGFAAGRTTAPFPSECITALDAASATIAAIKHDPTNADRVAEIDYAGHRTACVEAVR